MDEKNGQGFPTTADEIEKGIIPSDPFVTQQAVRLSVDKNNVAAQDKETSEDGQVTSQASDQDNIVDWDGPEDPQNPQNWTSLRKWTIIILISAITFNQALSSTIFAPGVPQAMRGFHSDNDSIATLLISIFVIGLAVGPLFLSPLTELYGRLPFMHATNFVFLIAAILSAVSVNIPMLLIFRLIMGISTIQIGGGYAADLMTPERRARAVNVWAVGPVLAPVVAPIAGGYICLKTSWRWTFGLVSIIGAVSTVATFLLLPETYPPRLLQLKAIRLRKETGNPHLRSKYDKGQAPAQLFRLSILRPTKMLLRSPIVGIVSLFLAIAYSYMYLMFTTFTSVFSGAYGFNTGEAGLSYLGLGVGSLIGQYSQDVFMKRYHARQLARNGRLTPEDQLPLMMLSGFLLSIGLFWYGWSIEYRVHWVVPIIGTGLCGLGITYCFLAVLTYLVEAYTIYAASALAANAVIRSIFGVCIPLAGPHLYARLGLGWGNSLLGFLCLAIVPPASLWLWKYGARVRSDPRFLPQL